MATFVPTKEGGARGGGGGGHGRKSDDEGGEGAKWVMENSVRLKRLGPKRFACRKLSAQLRGPSAHAMCSLASDELKWTCGQRSVHFDCAILRWK